jgi:Uma2 family endonuclease
VATDVQTRVPSAGDNRVDFRASWDDYLALARAVGDQRVLLAYDGERVELMTPGPEHEFGKVRIDRLVGALAVALGIPCQGMGSTRWLRPEASRGLEADTCYYLSAEKVAAAQRRPPREDEYPIPDLAIEIDISPSRIDRSGIYAALRVPEVWRFDRQVFRIDRLGAGGEYTEAQESRWLFIRPDELAALLATDAEDDSDFSEKVKAWAREILVPRRAVPPDGQGG